MDVSILWRAAVVQTVAVALLALVLHVALGKEFFEDWGWIAGPVAWGACAALTARVLGLDLAGALIGAALAGVPALLAVVAGAHWLGTVVAIGLFAMWCARLARDPGLPAETL